MERQILAALTSAALLFLPRASNAAPTEAPQAARSVHLRWRASDGDLFYNEVRVLDSVPNSYFVAAGFSQGYFGIQEHGKKDKVLFSVWDSRLADNPDAVASKDRVEVLYGDPHAVIKRFGGEGTGAQCKYPYAWKAGETYRFLVKAKVAGNKTAYTAWFYLNEAKQWKKLAVFRAPTGGSPLQDYYSFVEDFRRDGQSPRERRRARFGPGWVRSRKGDWQPILKARFTADDTPLENVDASTTAGAFELATGGEVKNFTKLDSILEIQKLGQGPPTDLPAR